MQCFYLFFNIWIKTLPKLLWLLWLFSACFSWFTMLWNCSTKSSFLCLVCRVSQLRPGKWLLLHKQTRLSASKVDNELCVLQKTAKLFLLFFVWNRWNARRQFGPAHRLIWCHLTSYNKVASARHYDSDERVHSFQQTFTFALFWHQRSAILSNSL